MHYPRSYIRWQRFVWLMCRGLGNQQKRNPSQHGTISLRRIASCHIGESWTWERRPFARPCAWANPPVATVSPCRNWFSVFPRRCVDSLRTELLWSVTIFLPQKPHLIRAFSFCNCTSEHHFLASATLHISAVFCCWEPTCQPGLNGTFKKTFNRLSVLHKLKYMIIKCPAFLHNDTNATWFGTANYLLIFWESLASFKTRFGICMPVYGRMKAVLLDPYRAEDTELSATSKFKHISICRQWMHHWQVPCLVCYDIFYITVCLF